MIQEKAVLPKIIDNQFIKNNITSKHFENGNESEGIKFRYNILSFTKNNRFDYEIVVSKIPDSNDMETILKYGFGHTHYRMKLKKIKGVIALQSIRYLYSEL